VERKIGPFFAVLVSLAGGALLVLAVIIFSLYGYCEDYCDRPPRSDCACHPTMWSMPIAAAAFGPRAAVVLLPLTLAPA
jgi:hypothetical protein